MGLKDTIANASNAALKATGDLRKSITYRQVESDYYDAATGGKQDRYEDYAIANKAIVSAFKSTEVDGNKILREDQKVTFLQADLSTPPKVKDLIIISGVDWWVVDFKEDPANALHIIQVRKN